MSEREPDGSQYVWHGTNEDTFGKPPCIELVEYKDKCQIGEDAHQQQFVEHRPHLELKCLQGIPQVHLVDIEQTKSCGQEQSEKYAEPIFVDSIQQGLINS